MDNNVTADRVERLAGRQTEHFWQRFLPSLEFDLLEKEFWLAEGSQCETRDTAGMGFENSSTASLMTTDRDFIQLEFSNLV